MAIKVLSVRVEQSTFQNMKRLVWGKSEGKIYANKKNKKNKIWFQPDSDDIITL